jgi:type IV pilus assembly protein PilB
MAIMDESRNVLSGFAYYLAEKSLLNKDAVLGALELANLNKTSYINFLIKQKLLDEKQIALSVAEYFGFPLFEINAFDRSLIPQEYLGTQIVRKHLALPLFKKNNVIYLAITDPTNENLHELQFLTGMDVRFFIVESSKLSNILDELLNSMILSEMSTLGEENVTVDSYKEEENNDITGFDIESAPVVNYVNKVLLDAIDKSASDIHFERYENSYRIRFRQQGILYAITSPPTKIATYLLARIKVMSNLDITEHRVPQDGRFKLIISKKRSVDFRVSVCPTLFGEKLVLRILDQSTVLQGIDQVGMNEEQKDHFLNALQKSQGMILVTGPIFRIKLFELS